MPFVRGQSGNPAGRKKGSISQRTEMLKNFWMQLLEGNLDHMQAELDRIRLEDPKAFFQYMYMINQLYMPKKTSTDITSDGVPIQIILPANPNPEQPRLGPTPGDSETSGTDIEQNESED